jgi:hypothetical protein
MPSCRSILRSARAGLLVWGGALVLCACSPALNWRDVRLAGSGVQVLFPCKPATELRTVRLNGMALPMSMSVCQAGGATYALAFADLGSADQVSSTRSAWVAAQVGNLGGSAQVMPPIPLKATQAPLQAEHHFLSGQMPDGTPIQQDIVFVVRKTRILQMTVMSPRVDQEAATIFFESLNWPENVASGGSPMAAPSAF